jgi:uncharacterized protein
MSADPDLPLFQQYQLQFAAHIRNPQTHPRPSRVVARRMRVYKNIVFGNIESVLANGFPICKRMIGKRLWRRLVRIFFIHHQSRSPLFRQIPEEFLSYLEQVESYADIPPIPGYFKSLAHYEWVELAVASSEAEVDMSQIDPSGDLLRQEIVLAPTLQLLMYDYPVHEISPKNRPEEVLPNAVYLAVYRNLSDDIRFVEINEMTHALLQRMRQSPISGEEALSDLALEMHYPPEQLIAFGLPILQHLRLQQLIVGTRR